MPYHESLAQRQADKKLHDFEAEITELSAKAPELIEKAESVRKKHRRRSVRTSPQRRADFEPVIGEISELMVSIRSALGKLLWYEVPIAIEERLKDASHRLQVERAKLRRMLG